MEVKTETLNLGSKDNMKLVDGIFGFFKIIFARLAVVLVFYFFFTWLVRKLKGSVPQFENNGFCALEEKK